LFEALETRLLYSIDVTTGALSPLLCGVSVAQTALLGGNASRQVEVATVRTTGGVGPFVRIDITQLAELRADAAQRREDLFQKASDRSSLLWSANNEWSPASPHDVTSGQTAQPSESIGDESEAEARSRSESPFRPTSRLEFRVSRVARAWNRVRTTPEPGADTDVDGDVDSYMDAGAGVPTGEGLTSTPWETPLTIAIIHHGDILLLPQPVQVDYDWGAAGDLFGSISQGPVSQGVSTGSTMSDPHVPTRVATGDSAATFTSTSADTQLYFSGSNESADSGAAQQVVSGGHARGAGPTGKTRSPVGAVVRGEDDESIRRGDYATSTASGAAKESHSRDSVIAGEGQGSLIGGEQGGRGLAGGTHATTISTSSSSLLGGGAAGDATVAAAGNTIVVASSRISAVAAAANAAGISWVSRAANGANAATGVVVGGAWIGARHALELARGVAAAVEGVAVPLLPEVADAAAAATGSATIDIAPVSTTGMLLGLAPVWNWSGTSAGNHDGWLDPEKLAGAWRIATAGSLIVTLAGCWYCASATRRAGRIRRRLAERASFATGRRIRFNPRAV